MDRSYKRAGIILCVIAGILIVTGLTLTLKEFIEEEDLFNAADQAGYYKISFNLNGASMIEHKYMKCKINNNECSIILPNATRRNGTVLGYSENEKDTEATYKIGESITLKDNISLYAISYSRYTMVIDGSDVDELIENELTCDAYNTSHSCNVTLPKFNKVGYENKGFSTSKASLTGFVYPGEEYELIKDEVFYPIYNTSSRHKSLNIVKTFTYQKSYIEVEKGCSESIYKEYLKYLDGINRHVPFLLLGNKITFVTNSSFDTIWGKTYVGMNFGPKSLKAVDIRCGSSSLNDYYATMVHEMAHSWDFHYGTKMGDNISSQSDVINLFNKYKSKNNRPFRDYSYTSIYEFVADMMRYYYFKYYVPRSGFSSLSYPSDIKKVLEKYICISRNNYDESKCS